MVNPMRHLTFLFSILLAVPAFAQQDDSEPDVMMCNRSHADVAQQIEGPWFLSQEQGVAVGADGSIAPGVSVPIPLTPIPPKRMEMRLATNGGFIFSSSDFQEDMLLDPATGTFALPEGMNFYDGNGNVLDVEESADCLWERMPRYAGTKYFDLGAAGNMEMTIVVHFASIVNGFGFVRFRGTLNNSSFAAVRPLMFTRPY